ncbi:MAG: SRPBCC family protein [Erythrobacter sp.]|nr:SRPBCC family protein [Erythrobacter sp.]
MRKTVLSIASLALASTATPATAEVIALDEDHFITRTEAIVEGDPKAVWLALISPARWWSSEHTWSADAANLTLMPQAGGCFCEKIPEVNEPGRFTLEGSVEHMRVLQAYPEVALRMEGALGPLQSEPVTGILTIALSEVEEGTRIVWEYNVGGKMRYEEPVIAQAVDGVMTLQLTRLAETLGMIQAPRTGPPPAPPPEEEPEASEGEEPVEEEAMISIDPEAVLEESDDEAEDEASEGPSVDEAFGDLSDPG